MHFGKRKRKTKWQLEGPDRTDRKGFIFLKWEILRIFESTERNYKHMKQSAYLRTSWVSFEKILPQ